MADTCVTLTAHVSSATHSILVGEGALCCWFENVDISIAIIVDVVTGCFDGFVRLVVCFVRLGVTRAPALSLAVTLLFGAFADTLLVLT